MTRKVTWLSGWIALAFGLIGCEQQDDTAVKALEELTTQLTQQVEARNDEITSLATEVQGCMKKLATAKGEAVVLTASTAAVSVPSLEGEANVQSLEALKTALNDASKNQEAALTSLKEQKSQCEKDLEAAVEAAAEAEAAKRAAREKRKAQEQKPTAVKKAEEEGTPTKGVRSRY